MDENLGKYAFKNVLTHKEKLFLWIYLPIHVFLLPLLLSILQQFYPNSISNADCNLIYYALGAILCLIFLFKFLRQNFDCFCDRVIPCLFTILTGYLLVTLFNYLISMVQVIIESQLDNINNSLVNDMALSNYGKTLAMAVFLAPLVEEPLFRAGIFGIIRDKNRFLAYTVSVIAFGLYHVWQPALYLLSPMYLLLIIDYIPAGIVLCWSYERTSSIWTPIALHMFINWINILALTAIK